MLENLDPESNLKYHSNFKYYSTDEFLNCMSVSETSFSILHCNIRSLNANYDKLTFMLNDLNREFSIIGLSEIKFTQNKEVVSNIEIPNYNFIYQQSWNLYKRKYKVCEKELMT